MTFDAAELMGAVRSHALALGPFDRESGPPGPMNVPGNGLTVGVRVDRIDPVAQVSGLAVTSARLVLLLRIYANAQSRPVDEIDADLLAASNALIAAYSADFTLGGLIKEVDLLVRHGIGLRAQFGWLRQEKALLRISDVTLPLIINDAWEQVP